MSRNAEFGLGRDEQNEIVAKAYANHILDKSAEIAGFHDWDHMVTQETNEREMLFKDIYGSGTGRGKVKWDEDRGTHIYEVRHPSGWIGHHIGPHTEMTHVMTPGESHDMWSYTDRHKHGLLSPMQPHEWPEPDQVDRHVDDWVKEQGDTYAEHVLPRQRRR